MPKGVSMEKKREWLGEFEHGKAVVSIAEQNGHDTRTIKKAIEDARRERDASLARSDLMKQALREHHDSLKTEIARIRGRLAVPDVEWGPLSWYDPSHSVYTRTVNEADFRVGVVAPPGRPKETTVTILDLLRQHLKGDKAWRLLESWERAYVSHVASRATLQKQVIGTLREHTGLDLRNDGRPPYLVSHTLPPLIYGWLMAAVIGAGNSVNPDTTSRLKKDIVADTVSGLVKFRFTDLAVVPGSEEATRVKILTAFGELLESSALVEVGSTYSALESAASRGTLAADEVLLFGFVPGQCGVCRRFGM